MSLGVSVIGNYWTGTGVDATTHAAVDSKATGEGIAPRVGLDIPLSEALSLYPRLYLGYAHSITDETSAGHENKLDESTWYVYGFAPLLVHPAPHAFFGLGPSFSHDLDHTYAGTSRENRGTTVGVGATVGGWL